MKNIANPIRRNRRSQRCRLAPCVGRENSRRRTSGRNEGEGTSCIPTLNRTFADSNPEKAFYFGIVEIAPGIQTSNESISGQSKELAVAFHAAVTRGLSVTQVALDVMSSTDRIFCGGSEDGVG